MSFVRGRVYGQIATSNERLAVLEQGFHLTYAGRVVTPINDLTIWGVPYTASGILGALDMSTINSSPSNTFYDLVAFVLSEATYGLTVYPFGTAPANSDHSRYLGTIGDFAFVQVLLSPFLAFQSDAYVSIAADGLHVKAFAGSSQNYGQITIESPTGINNLQIFTNDTTAFIETPPNQPTDINIAAGRNAGLVGGGNLAGGITYIQSITAISGSAWVACGTGITISTGAVGSPAVGAASGGIDLVARGTSIWGTSTGNLTVRNTGTGTLTISTSSTGGVLTITTANVNGIIISSTGTGASSGAVSLSAAGTGGINISAIGTGPVNITASGASTWQIQTGSSGLLTIKNDGSGGMTVNSGAGAMLLESTGSTVSLNATTGWSASNATSGNMTFTNTGRAINFTGSTLTMVGDVTANTTGTFRSQGSASGFFFYDRAGGPGNYAGWYRDATNFKMNTLESGDIWAINATTGKFVQNAWTNVTLQNTWATAAGYPQLSVRKLVPSGTIQIRGGLTAGNNPVVTGLIPAGFLINLTAMPIPAIYYNGTVWAVTACYIDSVGDLVLPNLAGVGAGTVLVYGQYTVD